MQRRTLKPVEKDRPPSLRDYMAAFYLLKTWRARHEWVLENSDALSQLPMFRYLVKRAKAVEGGES